MKMKSHNKKIVIFDLDGTILDTIGDLAAAVNKAIIHYGFEKRSVDEVKGFIGNGSLMLIRRAIGDESSERFGDEYVKEVRERFREAYLDCKFDTTRPYEGIIELFDELEAEGITVAVVTNKDSNAASEMLDHYFGARIKAVRAVSADGERKPDPKLTLSLLEELNFTPEDAIFVGDGMADLQVSKNANIDFIPVGYGYTSPEKLFFESGTKPAESVYALSERINECL